MNPVNGKPLVDIEFQSSKKALYRMLPSVNEVLSQAPLARISLPHSRRASLISSVRRSLDRLRSEIAAGLHTPSSVEATLITLPGRLAQDLSSGATFSIRRVINATGVILHTNLGRAPLSQMALDHLRDTASGYSNLEFDLERGERGKRDAHVESLLVRLFSEKGSLGPDQPRRAVIVNNCAAATFLALHSIARGRQVLVSRGELVEIGGGFRIPEIMEASGAFLREVGTTNRTRVADYEKAITSETALILRVHQSNFTMEGFVERPSLEGLVELGRRSGIPVFEDQGTGLVHGLEPYGIHGEATVISSLTSGCHLVAASGDKLFGGPQCGILIGQSKWIDQLRSNPLFRTFRADKLSYAALEATLVQYLNGESESIPVIKMLQTPVETIRDRCVHIAGSLGTSALTVGVVAVMSVIGGGTAPRSTLRSYALALHDRQVGASAILGALRKLETPVIGRVVEDQVLLDLRTVEPDFDDLLIRLLAQPFALFPEIER